jgi:hypothetical protein
MKWISTNDRLPEPNVDVLVNFIGWDDMVFQRVLEYCSIEKNFIDHNGESYEIDIVTHWTPLPKPPRQ